MKFKILAALPIFIAAVTVTLYLYGVNKPKSFVIAAPKVQLFLSEDGSITEKPPEDIEIAVETEVTNVTLSVTGEDSKDIVSTGVTTQHQQQRNHRSYSGKFRDLIYMNENEAWALLTNNAFTSYPTQPFGQIKSILHNVHSKKSKTISVPVWYWEDPSDDNNFNKVTTYRDWEVNEEIAEMCEVLFKEIYDDPSQPIINIADAGMGTWSVRGKMHRDDRTLSAHSIGASFDINPSTGTFSVNGTHYGNAYGDQPMPTEIWKKLPESHKKYHVLYVDSPIVKIFKSYGFYWGGDWKSSKDCMHLAFLGDGINAREIGQSNYEEFN